MKILIFLVLWAYAGIVLSHDGISRVWDGIGYRRQRIMDSQNRALDHIYDPKVKAIVSQRIDQINKRIPIMSNVDVAHVSSNNDESKNFIPEDIPGINYKRENILNSQQQALDHIEEPHIKSIVANRIDAINKKIPIMSYEIPNSLKMHEKKIIELQNSEKIALNDIDEPTLKYAVRSRIDEENKSIKYIKESKDVDTKFSNALDAIHARMTEIKKSQEFAVKNIKDAAVRETALKKINKENEKLSKKAKEIDAKLEKSLNTIHKRMAELKDIEATTLERIADPALKETVRVKLEKQSIKIPTILSTNEGDETSAPIAEISNKIEDLEYAEYKTLEQIEDSEIQSIVLNSIDEHNKEIPVLLKSNDVDAAFTQSLEAVRSRINAEVEKSINVPLDGIKDASIKDLIRNRIAAQNQKRLDKSKEIEANLTASLTEIHNRISALKKSENQVINNIADPNIKEKTLNKIDEQYKKIPTLLLPGLVDLKFGNALTAFNAKMEGLQNYLNLISTNVTNPMMQAAMQSKMNFVNYKLTTKFNQLKDNFTSFLAAKTDDSAVASELTADSDDELAEEIVNVPHLMKTFDVDTEFPLIQAEIQKKIASKQIPTDVLLAGITNPAVKAVVLSKLDVANEKIKVKSDEVNANLSAALTEIRNRIAELKSLEDETVKKTTDPTMKEAVADGIEEHNKNIPKLLLPFGIAANFTKALDDFHAKIDDLKNTVDVATENITIPAIKAMVLGKLHFVNQMLLKKYDLLDSNFTSILGKIEERFANLTADEPTTEAAVELDQDFDKVPVLTKTLDDAVSNFSRISGIIHSKIEGRFANISLIGVKIPAIKALITDKLNEKSKNMSVILSQIDANLTKSLEVIQNKTEELQKLEISTLDNIDDPAVQADALGQIEEENKNIPVLLASKRDDKKKPVPAVPKPNMFRMRLPSVIRF